MGELAVAEPSPPRYSFDEFAAIVMAVMMEDRVLDVDDMCEKFFEALDFRRRGTVDAKDFGDFFRDNGDNVSSRMMTCLVEAMDRSLGDEAVSLDDLQTFVGELLGDTTGKVNVEALDPYGITAGNSPGRTSSSMSGRPEQFRPNPKP